MPAPGEYNTSYVKLLLDENRIHLLEDFKGAKKHHQMQCLKCDHTWSATPLSKRQTLKKNGVSGCPNCNNKRKQEVLDNKQTNTIHDLSDRGIEILSEWTGLHTTQQKLTFKNTHCGHVFETYPGNVIHRNIDCVICGKEERTKVINKWSKANSAKWKETADEWSVYKSVVTSLTEQTYKKYKKRINPKNYPRGKAGIDGAYHLDHIVPKRFCFDNNIPAEICADSTNLQMISWRDNVGSRNHIKGTIPHKFLQYVDDNNRIELYIDKFTNAFPSFKSYVDIADITATLYSEQHNFAVIVIPITQPYANQKIAKITAQSLIAADIRYVMLFEDEIIDNFDLVVSKLSHLMSTNTATKIHARKCIIRECDNKQEKTDLLKANHVQGNDNAQFNYGAYYEGRLVAVMTFCKPRVALGQKKQSAHIKWELSRFCTDVGFTIPGIASKLLKHFQRNHEWDEIYSYADKRWSVGNMYDQLGFDRTANNPPDYFYVMDGKRKHRWNYRKDILKTKLDNFDPALTEYQNMENHGFWRVWDCGTLKFTMLNNCIRDV